MKNWDSYCDKNPRDRRDSKASKMMFLFAILLHTKGESLCKRSIYYYYLFLGWGLNGCHFGSEKSLKTFMLWNFIIENDILGGCIFREHIGKSWKTIKHFLCDFKMFRDILSTLLDMNVDD